MREGSSQGLKQQNLGFKRAKSLVELPPALNPCQAKIHELWANGMFARQVAGSRIQVQARFGIRRGGGVSRIGVTGVAALVHINTLALRSDVSDAALTLVWGSRAAKVVPQSMVGFWCFNRLRSWKREESRNRGFPHKNKKWESKSQWDWKLFQKLHQKMTPPKFVHEMKRGVWKPKKTKMCSQLRINAAVARPTRWHEGRGFVQAGSSARRSALARLAGYDVQMRLGRGAQRSSGVAVVESSGGNGVWDCDSEAEVQGRKFDVIGVSLCWL